MPNAALNIARDDTCRYINLDAYTLFHELLFKNGNGPFLKDTEGWLNLNFKIDSTASHFDLLNVGIAFGTAGTDRDVISNDWFAMPSMDWGEPMLSQGVFIKMY